MVPNTLTNKHFQDTLKSSRNSGIGVCIHKETTLKVMVQNKIQVRRNSFY
jgi:hypothetical protein